MSIFCCIFTRCYLAGVGGQALLHIVSFVAALFWSWGSKTG